MNATIQIPTHVYVTLSGLEILTASILLALAGVWAVRKVLVTINFLSR